MMAALKAIQTEYDETQEVTDEMKNSLDGSMVGFVCPEGIIFMMHMCINSLEQLTFLFSFVTFLKNTNFFPYMAFSQDVLVQTIRAKNSKELDLTEEIFEKYSLFKEVRKK